jgi:hypothetical protein
VDWLQLNTDGPVARVYDSEQLQQEYVLAQTVLERAQALEQLGDEDSHHDGDRQWLGRSSVPLIYDRKMSFNITVTDSNFGDHVVSGIDHTHTTAHHLRSHMLMCTSLFGARPERSAVVPSGALEQGIILRAGSVRHLHHAGTIVVYECRNECEL